jgi:hypothetical protein
MMEDRKFLLHRIIYLFYIIITHKTLSTIKIIKTILVEFFFFVTGPLIRFQLASPLPFIKPISSIPSSCIVACGVLCCIYDSRSGETRMELET